MNIYIYVYVYGYSYICVYVNIGVGMYMIYTNNSSSTIPYKCGVMVGRGIVYDTQYVTNGEIILLGVQYMTYNNENTMGYLKKTHTHTHTHIYVDIHVYMCNFAVVLRVLLS